MVFILGKISSTIVSAKRLFLQKAEDLGFQGAIKDHVDKILQDINKDKTKSQPFFFSDMVPIGATKKTTRIIDDVDDLYFPLSSMFSLTEASRKAVQIYINGVQLVHNKDYTFNSEGYALITATKQQDDVVDIYEYETTNGSYIPPTPTKLGLYPAYEPVKYTDSTYVESLLHVICHVMPASPPIESTLSHIISPCSLQTPPQQ